MRFQVLLSLWSVTSWLCIDKIPEVAKTKVSKPKRYSLSHTVCVCVCVCVWEREREGHITVESAFLISGLCTANTYKQHHCVCHVTLFPSRTWTDGKTKDIINRLYFYFERWSSRLWKGALQFRRVLAVFGQSQCTVPVGQSEKTALVGRRDFAFERGRA